MKATKSVSNVNCEYVDNVQLKHRLRHKILQITTLFYSLENNNCPAMILRLYYTTKATLWRYSFEASKRSVYT